MLITTTWKTLIENELNLLKEDLKKQVDESLNQPLALPTVENEDKSNDLQGHGMKTIIPANITDIWTRVETLLGLKLCGHADNLTEARNRIVELYKTGEIEYENEYRNALDKF